MYFRYSCKIIWLDVLTTNNDPNVVLHLYLLAVLENYGTLYLLSGPHTNCIIMCMYWYLIIYIGCPSIIRSDCGTENTSLAAVQMALRHEHNDAFSGEKSFRFGSSTTNTVRNFL